MAPSLSPAFFDDEQERLQQEQLRKEADAAAQQQAQQQQQQPASNPSNKQTPREAAYDPNTQKVDAERGFFTEAADWAYENLDGLNAIDNYFEGLREIAPDEPIVNFVADAIPNRQQVREATADIPVVGQAVAAGEGMGAFALTPFTLASRLTNQQTSRYAEPPSEMKDTWGGEVAFELGRLLTPALLGFGGLGSGGAAAAGKTAVGTLAAESGLETINQRSADDLILGREAAIKIGEAANLLGYDGAQVTKDLIEGTKPEAQAVVAVAGFLQNFGINLGAEQLLFQISKQLGKRTTSEIAEEIAEVTGKNADEVQASLDNVEMPTPNRDLDINEAQNIDTGVPKAPEGQTINEEAMIAATLRRQAPHLTDADVRGFTNYRVFSKDHTIQQSLQEAVQFIDKLEPGTVAHQKVFQDADNWLRQFVDETNTSIDLDRALVELPFSEMVSPLDETARAFSRKGEAGLTEASIATEPGAAALTIIGEELGQRLNVAARNAVNLDNGSKDFSKAVEDFLDLQDKAELFLMPLRRYKQRWNVGGVAQQGDFVGKLKQSVGVSDAKQVDRKLTDVSPARDYQAIYKDADAVGQTPRELWEAYKAGDADAGETFKQFLNLISYAPPSTALSHIDQLEGALFEQLKKGNKQATTQLLYASYLTRLAPQTASVSSNILNVVKEPVGIALSGEGRYALGQVFGALSAFSDALQVGKRVFKSGVPVNTGSKLDAAVYDSKLIDNKLDALWEGTQRELTESKAGKREWTTAWMSYIRQKIANHPLNSVAGRALMAGDEVTKVLYGSMTASGRAFREAGNLDIKRGTKEFKDLITKHYKEVFLDGVKHGELNPSTGVSDAASALTFSQSIPRDGNVIDGAFRNLQDAAQENEFWKFVSPFTRVSYWTLEKGGVFLASSLPLPIRSKEWLLGFAVPRYKKILAGEMGELAQLQLKSNIAFAHYSAFMVGGLSGAGLMTGNNPPQGMPKTSFIIPTNNKDGYVAIPYGRLEPVATPFAVIADLVQNFRDNVITEKDYNKALESVVVSLGLSTLDKSFMTGMSNISSLLDVNNFGEGTVVSGANSIAPIVTSRVLPIGAGAALTRMVADWVNPYDTISKGDPSVIRNIFSAIGERNFGGATNPVKFNPLTGDAVQTTGQLGKDNYWKGVIATITNELFVPGKVKTGQQTEILKQLQKNDFDLKRLYNFRTFDGVGLSLEEQSILSKDTHDVGKLPERLELYFNSDEYRRSWNIIRTQRQRGTQDSLRAADKELELVRSRISGVFNDAKDAAGRNGRLRDQPLFQQKRNDLMFGQVLSSNSVSDEVAAIINLPVK